MKRVTEDEMVGWHHQFNEHEVGQALGHGKLSMVREMEAWSATVHGVAKSWT